MPEQAIAVACESCGVKLKLKDSLLGKKIKCPKCGVAFMVAAPSAPTKKAAPSTDEEDSADDEPGDDEEQRPQKKKRKGKKKKKQQSASPLPYMIAGVVFLVLLVAGGVAVALMSGGRSKAVVEAPELGVYKSASFTTPAPKGWKMEEGGSESRTWVEFTSGDVKIRIFDDSAGFGDIMSGPERGVRNDDHTQDVVHGVHLGKAESLKEDFADFSEEAPIPFDSRLGLARMSHFKAKAGMWGSKIRGTRATLQSGTKTIVVRCTCPEKSWEVMKATFEAICRGVAPGVRA